MRLFPRLLLLALCMGVLSGGAAFAAEAGQSFLDNLASKFSSPAAKSGEEVCPVTPPLSAADTASQNAAASNNNMKDLFAKTQAMAVSLKNLPSGTYRERCFACLTGPNEDFVRALSCVCPTSDKAFSRISIPLNQCKADENIALCGGMLICGKCELNDNLAKEMARPVPTENVLQQMFPNAVQQRN